MIYPFDPAWFTWFIRCYFSFLSLSFFHAWRASPVQRGTIIFHNYSAASGACTLGSWLTSLRHETNESTPPLLYRYRANCFSCQWDNYWERNSNTAKKTRPFLLPIPKFVRLRDFESSFCHKRIYQSTFDSAFKLNILAFLPFLLLSTSHDSLSPAGQTSVSERERTMGRERERKRDASIVPFARVYKTCVMLSRSRARAWTARARCVTVPWLRLHHAHRDRDRSSMTRRAKTPSPVSLENTSKGWMHPAAKNTREERKGETSAECRARIFEPSSHYICIYIYIYTLFFLDFMFFTERERFFLASNTVCGFLREERVNLIHSSPIRSVRPWPSGGEKLSTSTHVRFLFSFFIISLFPSFLWRKLFDLEYMYICDRVREIKYRELVYPVDACRKLGIGDLRRMANGE